MVTFKTQIDYMVKRPVLAGFFTVLIGLVVGAGIAVSTGFVNPAKTFADII